MASRALEHAVDADLLVDLHWTLAQCRMAAGLSEESLATLDRALASPGLSARDRARLLVLAARTHTYLGDYGKADRVAAGALAAAEEAGDSWAMGWALHVMAAVTMLQGHMTGALPLLDRALGVAQSDPALADLRLALQINKAVTLGDLDRFEEALAVSGQARRLADQIGTAIRLAHAHSARCELLFATGRWDDALAEAVIVPEDLKEPGVACGDLSIAAVICFHRGQTGEARRHLAAAVPHAERFGHRFIGPLALARSLDRERDGALPEALAMLTPAFDDTTKELVVIDDLLADAVRLAVQAGDLGAARTLAGRADALAAASDIPHRQANALYCRGLADHDAPRLLAAADRYQDSGRPLPEAMALEAAAAEFTSVGDHGRGRDALTRAVEAYTSLGASHDVARIQAAFHAHGIRPGPAALPARRRTTPDDQAGRHGAIVGARRAGIPDGAHEQLGDAPPLSPDWLGDRGAPSPANPRPAVRRSPPVRAAPIRPARCGCGRVRWMRRSGAGRVGGGSSAAVGRRRAACSRRAASCAG